MPLTSQRFGWNPTEKRIVPKRLRLRITCEEAVGGLRRAGGSYRVFFLHNIAPTGAHIVFLNKSLKLINSSP